MAKYEPVKVSAEDEGQKLARWLQKYYPEIAFAQIQKSARKGEIRVNSGRVQLNKELSAGDLIRLPPIFFQSPKTTPKQRVTSPRNRDYMRSLILYQDKDLIVLNKPSGLSTQGGSGISKSVDDQLDALKDKDDDPMPRLVHRLDKDTSGLLVIGRTLEATRHLQAAFKSRSVQKIYLAVTIPAPKTKEEEGEIRAGLIRAETGKEKIVIDDELGQSARTHFKVLDKAGKEAALVAFAPQTGRMHQIRVHSAKALEAPILGDFKYGFEKESLTETPLDTSLHLHAFRLILPGLGKKPEKNFEAPLPRHIQKTLEYFGFTLDHSLLEEWAGRI